MKTLILSVAGVLLMLTAESLLGNFPGPQWDISSKVTPHSQGQSVSTDWLVLGYKGLAPQFDSGHLWRTLPSNPLSTLQGTGRAFAAVHHNSASSPALLLLLLTDAAAQNTPSKPPAHKHLPLRPFSRKPDLREVRQNDHCDILEKAKLWRQ